MALTPQEQAELDELNAIESQTSTQKASRLTPDEQRELDELNAIESSQQSSENEQEPGIIQKALAPVAWAAEQYDIYGGGASTRAGLMALAKGENPFIAAAKQYGKTGAPSGEEIIQASPLRDQPFVIEANKRTAERIARESGISSFGGYPVIPQYGKGAGAILEAVADPAQIIPIGAGLKYLGKGGAVAAKVAGRGAAMAADVATGTKVASTIERATEKVVKNTADYLSAISKPKIRKDYSRLDTISKEHAIPIGDAIDTADFDKTSTIALANKAKAATPTGERVRIQLDEARDAASDAFDTAIAGEPLRLKSISEKDAGRAIRDALEAKRAQVIGDADFTYTTTADQISGGERVPLNPESKASITREFNKYKKYLQDKASGGATKEAMAEAREILGVIGRLQKATDDVTSFAERIKEVGRDAFGKKIKGTEYQYSTGILPKIYNAAKEAFIDTTRKRLGDDVADSLIQNNKNISEFLAKTKRISDVAGKQNLADEEVFRSLIKNGNSDEVREVVEAMPELKKQLATTMMESFITRDAAGTITNWNNLRQVFSKKRVDQLKHLIDENQAKSIGDISYFVDEVIGPKINPPAAGVSGSWRNIIESVQDDILNTAVIDLSKNKALKESGIKGLVEKARSGGLKTPAGLKQLEELSTTAKKAISEKIPGFSGRKATLRGYETTKEKDKNK